MTAFAGASGAAAWLPRVVCCYDPPDVCSRASIFAAFFAPDARQARIWDLRSRRCMTTLAAHSALITSVCFAPYGSGELLATAAHDGLVKLWRRRDWVLHATLAGHDGKVMCVDFANTQLAGPDAGLGAGGSPRLVSAGFDRTFKVWAADA